MKSKERNISYHIKDNSQVEIDIDIPLGNTERSQLLNFSFFVTL